MVMKAAISASLFMLMAVGACSTTAATAPVTVTVIPTSSATPSVSAPMTDEQIADSVQSGVVRVQTVTCGGIATGSGFLLAPNLVATVAHVVEGAASVSVRGDKGVTKATVIGLDARRDLALLQLKSELPGHVFTFSTSPLKAAAKVMVIGYPSGQPRVVATGSVMGTNAEIELGDRTLNGLIKLDATVFGGNSGGPLVTSTGAVAGLLEAGPARIRAESADGERIVYAQPEGPKYAVAGDTAAPLLAAWAAKPVSVAATTCDGAVASAVTITSQHAEAQAIAESLSAYAESINSADYDIAWQFITGRLREQYGNVQTFAKRQESSFLKDLTVEKAAFVDPLTDSADVRMLTKQNAAQGPKGLPCAAWHLQYTLKLTSGYWRIDGAKELEPVRACTATEAGRFGGDGATVQ